MSVHAKLFVPFFLNFSDRMEPAVEGVVDTGVVSKLQSSLERVEKELQEAKERKASLERECVIYQTQLDVSDTTRSYQCMYMYIMLRKLIVDHI